MMDRKAAWSLFYSGMDFLLENKRGLHMMLFLVTLNIFAGNLTYIHHIVIQFVVQFVLGSIAFAFQKTKIRKIIGEHMPDLYVSIISHNPRFHHP